MYTFLCVRIYLDFKIPLFYLKLRRLKIRSSIACLHFKWYLTMDEMGLYEM